MRLLGVSRSYAVKTTWELPVEIHGDDAERYFDVVGVISPPWVIEGVEGIGHRGELPSRHVVLDRSGGSSGRLVLAAQVAPWQAGGGQDYPPDFLETRADEAALRRSLQQLPPLGRRICDLLGTCP